MKKNRTHETRFLRNKLIAFALACTAALALASCTQSAAADVGEQAARETAFAHAGVSQDDVLSLEVKISQSRRKIAPRRNHSCGPPW